VLNLGTAEVEALFRYIDEHKDEVMAVHAEIEARIARGNSPEVQEKLKGSHAKLEALRAELERRRAAQEAGDAGDPC
jgi:hypothetical protein